MRSYSAHTICLAAFLLLIVATGCGDPDKTGGNPGLTAPTVSAVAPVAGSVGACINTTVSARFSKAMNPATITVATFTLTGPNGTALAGQIAYDATSNTATFTPSANLAPSTLYNAQISTQVRDAFGNDLANAMVWSFTTGVTVCSGVGAPAVQSATPGNGACPNTVATAAFSEAMNPATIDNSTFTLTGPGTTPVNGQVTYDTTSNSAIFTPGNSLATNTTYYGHDYDRAADLLGQNLAQRFCVDLHYRRHDVSTTPAAQFRKPPQCVDRHMFQRRDCGHLPAGDDARNR